VPLGSHVIRCFRVVNHRDEPVAVLPNVEYHISLNIVGIFERATNLWEIASRGHRFDPSHVHQSSMLGSRSRPEWSVREKPPTKRLVNAISAIDSAKLLEVPLREMH
jgi:hypothetical protein